MRIPQTGSQRIKAGVHLAQAFFAFITGCLTLAVMTKSGGFGGATGFCFGLCFLTIPALIYLIMVPMWTRAWRLANVYAYVSIDMLFTILWFAVFVAVAVWNAAGIKEGKSDSDSTKSSSHSKSSGTCSSFAYGSESKCEVSKASVGFGVIMCLLFAASSGLSFKTVMDYRRTGIMPNGNSRIHGQAERLRNDDADKDTWNTNIDEHDPSHDDDNPFHDPAVDERLAYGQIPHDINDGEEQGLGLLRHDHSGHSNTAHDESEDGPHPGRPLSIGSSKLSVEPPHYDPALVPSAFSPAAYEQTPGGRVEFPHGRYDEV